MNDLISRQAALDALEREQTLDERPITETRWFDLGLRKAQEVLSDLPSAEPERKTGKWLERRVVHSTVEWQSCKCSVCGRYDTRLYTYSFYEPNFCSRCGAEMKKGEEE